MSTIPAVVAVHLPTPLRIDENTKKVLTLGYSLAQSINQSRTNSLTLGSLAIFILGMTQFVSSIITLKDSNYLYGSWYVGLAVMITGNNNILNHSLNYLLTPL